MREPLANAGALPAEPRASRMTMSPSFVSAYSETEAGRLVISLRDDNGRLKDELDNARLAIGNLQEAQQRLQAELEKSQAELEKSQAFGRDAEFAKQTLQDELDSLQRVIQEGAESSHGIPRRANVVVPEPSEEPPTGSSAATDVDNVHAIRTDEPARAREELARPRRKSSEGLLATSADDRAPARVDELLGVLDARDAEDSASAGSILTRTMVKGPDQRPSLCRAEGVRQTLEALEFKLAEVSSCLPDSGSPRDQADGPAPSPKFEIQSVLAELKSARTSLVDLEAVEREVVALRAERESSIGVPAPVSDLITVLLQEIDGCQGSAANVSSTARGLQNWIDRLGVLWPGEFACVELGLCFERSSDALRATKTKCEALFQRLLSVKSWCIDFLPHDATALHAYITERLGPSHQGIVLLSDWGSIPRGMHLVSVNDKEIPCDATLSSFAQGEAFELKKGVVLKFSLPLPSTVTTPLLELVESLRSASSALQLQSANVLPLMSLPTVPVTRDMAEQRYVGSSMLKTFEARLVWEMDLADVERHVWGLIPNISALCEKALSSTNSERIPLDAAGLPSAAADVPGEPELRICKGKGPGPAPKSKSKAKGKAPPSSPKAGKDKGKGKGPPPPAAKGSGKKGKPPPVKGKAGKPSPAVNAGNPDVETADAVREAAERRKNQPLFGKLTRRPDHTMLANQKREFYTFVDRCGDEAGTANIADAFGERGCLLLHACIAEVPSKKTKSSEKEKDAAPKLVQVIKGEEGPMGDKRRMDAEIRFRKLFPCTNNCAGRGLVIAPDCSPCRRSHELAFAFDSLDFELLEQCAKLADLDLNAFVPPLAIREDAEEDKAETDKVNQLFILPQERQALAQFEMQALRASEGSRSISVMELHSLERKLLPFVHVRSLAEKLKLYQINVMHPVLEREATEAFNLVGRACDAVRESSFLLDLLAVTLQIANYVKNFGDTDQQREGFSLMRLQYYQGFWIGKHPFLSVLCAFLMNLRPREKPKEPTSSAATGDAPSPSSRSAAAAASRRQSKGQISVSRSSPRKQRGPGFVDKLEKDLTDAREVCRSRLTLPQLEMQVQQFEQMAGFVERCFESEAELFQPHTIAPSGADPADALAAQSSLPEEHLAELVAWLGGRRRLLELHEKLIEARSRLHSCAEQVRMNERKLLEFASLRPDEFKSLGYVDVLSAVLAFVDQLKQTWTRHEANPDELRELQLMLLAAAPLQILFGTNCLEEAFSLWLTKSVTHEAVGKQWDENTKCEALRSLFQLFDTNADGSVDAEEMRVTLRAFGIHLPEGSELHYEVVRRFDGDGSGQLDLSEFRSFVEWRIQAAFRLFLQHRVSASLLDESPQEGAALATGDNAISEADLKLVADSLGYGSLAEETYARMIHILDTEGEVKDGVVNHQEFEQLILMKPDSKVGRISSGHLLNQAVDPSTRERAGSALSDDTADGGRALRRKTSRHFAWDTSELEPLAVSSVAGDEPPSANFSRSVSPEATSPARDPDPTEFSADNYDSI